MKAYFVNVSGREEGPYSDAQVAQLFADARVNRSTRCRPADGGDWKTIDEYLPMLKYGTQLPAPSTTSTTAAPTSGVMRIKVTDVDVPFTSVLKMMFKIFGAWLIVLVCYIPLIFIFWVLVFAGIFTFFSQHLPR